MPAAAAPLWEEDALIGLPSGDFNDSLMDTYTLFDRDGTQVGTTVGRCDVGQFWGYLSKGELLSNNWMFIRIEMMNNEDLFMLFLIYT